MDIKFRGKTLHDGSWHYGYFVKRRGYDYGIIYDEEGVGYDVDLDTVGMITGLKARVNIDIYDGDIIKTSYQQTVGVVEYKGHIGCFTLLDGQGFTTELSVLVKNKWGLEVLGNIYDHSNLFKKGGHEI